MGTYLDKARDSWNAVAGWEPHWLIQATVAAAMIWVLTKASMWIWRRTVSGAKSSYAELIASYEQQDEKRQDLSRFVAAQVQLQRLGGIEALAMVIKHTTGAIFLAIVCATVVVLLFIEHEHMPPIVKLFALASAVSLFIGVTRQGREAIISLEGIHIAANRDHELMVDDEDQFKEFVTLWKGEDQELDPDSARSPEDQS